jgi:hypothetical protein
MMSWFVRQLILGDTLFFEFVDDVLIPAGCRSERFVLGILGGFFWGHSFSSMNVLTTYPARRDKTPLSSRLRRTRRTGSEGR